MILQKKNSIKEKVNNATINHTPPHVRERKNFYGVAKTGDLSLPGSSSALMNKKHKKSLSLLGKQIYNKAIPNPNSEKLSTEKNKIKLTEKGIICKDYFEKLCSETAKMCN